MTDSLPRHFVRYGTHSEQKFLTGPFLDTYEGLFFNANMVAYAPAALSSFIGERAPKPYFIDPVTHGFQGSLDNLRSLNSDGELTLKASIVKLIERYGDPVRSRISAGEVVLPEDFEPSDTTRIFVERVLKFQVCALPEQRTDLSDYYEFAGVANPLDPLGVVAPFFYMSASTYQEWLPVNKLLVEYAADAGGDSLLVAEILIDKSVLTDASSAKALVETYSELPCNVIHLWVDGFEEWAVSTDMLKVLVSFISDLKKPVIIAYGGYFSTLLARLGFLAGVCHGPGYGESRPAYPVGGGIPRARYYHPDLHKRFAFAEAISVIRPFLGSHEQYLNNVCDCPACQELFETEEDASKAFAQFGQTKSVTINRQGRYVTVSYSTTEALEVAAKHYMWVKQREFTQECGLSEELKMLRSAASKAKRSLGLTEVQHCLNWAKALGPSS